MTPRHLIAADQIQGQQDDDNRWFGFGNGLWMGPVIWALMGAVFAAILGRLA